MLLAALALATGTGAAVWFLPAGATQEAPAPTVLAMPSAVTPSASASPVASEKTIGPSGYVAFVDTARYPGADLPAAARRDGVRWYTLGHLVAGGDGCAAKWNGSLDLGANPVANRIGGLRAEGADAGPVFGGPSGRELADACVELDRLTTAYRRVVSAFGSRFAEFDIRDSSGDSAVLRRARALRTLQAERPLSVSFTLPLGPAGLAPRDVALLRATREAGARVSVVNLLTSIEPRQAPEGRMRRVAAAVRLAQGQIARAHALTDPAAAWRQIAVTCVLVSPDDLGATDARKLSAFAGRHGLAWLSARGAEPAPVVAQILRATRT